MVVVGAWQCFLGWGGMEDMGNEIQLPSKAQTEFLPMILPLPIQFVIAPVFSAAEPPPSMSSPSSTTPDPERDRWGLSQRSDLDTGL